MKKFSLSFVIVAILAAIYFFRPKEYYEVRNIMNTICEIKVITRKNPKKAIDCAFNEIKRVEELASFFNGEIARFNKNKNIELSPMTIDIIKKGIIAGDLTFGAFDITIGALKGLYDFKAGKIPTEKEIKDAIKLVNYKKIKIDGNRVIFDGKIDLSGIAKGYAVDLAVKKLKEMGVKTGLVNCGGDLAVFGKKVWKIGIKHPRTDGIIKILKLKDCAVATSGDYENFIIKENKRYHHILDPKTGMPTNSEIISSTIIGDSCYLCDAIATAVFVLGKERSKKLLDSLKLYGILITKDLEVVEIKN